MASSKDYLQFVLEQLSEFTEKYMYPPMVFLYNEAIISVVV
ncbi:MAG: hypothetical protein ACLRHG_07955 [Coprococcus phoceensis]